MDTIHPGRCTWVEATMQAIIRLWISSPPLINEIAQFHRQKFPFSILAMFNFLRKYKTDSYKYKNDLLGHFEEITPNLVLI